MTPSQRLFQDPSIKPRMSAHPEEQLKLDPGMSLFTFVPILTGTVYTDRCHTIHTIEGRFGNADTLSEAEIRSDGMSGPRHQRLHPLPLLKALLLVVALLEASSFGVCTH